MQKMTQIVSLALSLAMPGAALAHGTHAVDNATPLSDTQHGVLHAGEWGLIAIVVLLVLGSAIRVLKPKS